MSSFENLPGSTPSNQPDSLGFAPDEADVSDVIAHQNLNAAWRLLPKELQESSAFQALYASAAYDEVSIEAVTSTLAKITLMFYERTSW